MTLDDFYYMMHHPVDSIANVFQTAFGVKKDKKVAMDSMAFPTSTIPSTGDEESLYNYNTTRGNKVKDLMR